MSLQVSEVQEHFLGTLSSDLSETTFFPSSSPIWEGLLFLWRKIKQPGADIKDSFGDALQSIINKVLKCLQLSNVLTKIKVVLPFYLKKYARDTSPTANKSLFKWWLEFLRKCLLSTFHLFLLFYWQWCLLKRKQGDNQMSYLLILV